MTVHRPIPSNSHSSLSPVEFLARVLQARLHVTMAEVFSAPAHLRSLPHVTVEPKLLLVTEGVLHYALADHAYTLRPGSLLFRPAHSLSTWRVLSRTACRLCHCTWRCEPAKLDFALPRVRHDLDPQALTAAFERLMLLRTDMGISAALEAEAELKLLLAHAFRQVGGAATAGTAVPGAGTLAEAAVRRMVAELSRTYAQPDALDAALHSSGMNRDYLRVIFKQRTGLSPQRFLTTLRLQAARELLRTSELPVKQVAAAAGYANPLFFSRHYHAHFGHPPLTERQGR